MGGRGAYSMSYGGEKRSERTRLLGISTNVHVADLGGPSDARGDVLELARQAGFQGVYGTDGIMTQSMGLYVNRIAQLEREYGALKEVPTDLAGAGGTGYAAAASYSDGGGNATLILNRVAMRNAADAARAQERDAQSGFTMPTNGRLTSNANYTVTHEYGHLLQNALYQRAKANGYTGTRSQYQASVFSQVRSIAESRYGGTSGDLSRYGHYNGAEFFAESFANANSGRPTAYGNAMRDWLRDNRL